MFKEILVTYLFTRLIGREKTKKLSTVLQKYTIKTSAIIFGFVSIAHSIRFVFGINANVAGWIVPLWVSLVVAIITGYLAFGLWKLK